MSHLAHAPFAKSPRQRRETEGLAVVSLALASRSKAAAQHPDFSQALMAEFMQMMSCLRSQQFQAVVVSHSLLSPCRTSSWTLTTCIDSSSCIANSHAFPFSQAVITQLKEMMSCFTLTSSAPTGMACWRSTGRTQHPVVTGDVRKYPASCRNISSSKLRAASQRPRLAKALRSVFMCTVFTLQVDF